MCKSEMVFRLRGNVETVHATVHAWLHMTMAAPDTSALSCRIALVLHTRILLSCPHVTSLWPDASTSTEKMGVPAA